MGGGARRIRARAPLNSAVSARQRTPRERIRAREKPDVGPREAAMPAELQGTQTALALRTAGAARVRLEKTLCIQVNPHQLGTSAASNRSCASVSAQASQVQ